MAKYRLVTVMSDEVMLYETFKSVERQCIKCLTLNPKDINSPKRMELFRFRVQKDREFSEDPIEYGSIAVSYMLDSDCYTLDFLRNNNGKVISTTPDRAGCENSTDLVKQFLDRMSAVNGGTIARLNSNKNSVNDKTPEPNNINYYLGVLDGLNVRHKGSEPTAKWMYTLSDEEVHAVSEAFKSLFRTRQDIKSLGITESYSIRAAYDANLIDEANGNTEIDENSVPMF